MTKYLLIMTLLFFGFTHTQNSDIQKTLDEINTRFKNFEVGILKWPEDLHQNLGTLKKSAFIAFPREKSNDKLPLLIALHGAGGKTWSLNEQLVRSSKVKGLSLAELAGKDLVLLEPNSFGNWDSATLNIMLDYVLETYPIIDSNKIYVMGHSMGGRGAWDWIQVSPHRFAAAAPCGFSGVSERDNFKKLINLPVWGMVGGSDEKNIGSVKLMVKLLEEAGNSNIKFTSFSNANHAQGNASVFSTVEWIDWMLTFSK